MDNLIGKEIMKTNKDLILNTKIFFKSYWNVKNDEIPDWSEKWNFNETIPNNDKQGCYALFNNEEIIYIGSGVGKGSGTYKNNGLGFRLKRYFKVNKSSKVNTNKYVQTDDWNEVTSIRTIGFTNEHYWLASALEIYLINKLNPRRNKFHKKYKNKNI